MLISKQYTSARRQILSSSNMAETNSAKSPLCCGERYIPICAVLRRNKVHDYFYQEFYTFNGTLIEWAISEIRSIAICWFSPYHAARAQSLGPS